MDARENSSGDTGDSVTECWRGHMLGIARDSIRLTISIGWTDEEFTSLVADPGFSLGLATGDATPRCRS